MKINKLLRICSLTGLLFGASIIAPTFAQDGKAQMPAATTPKWTKLADQLINLYGNQSFDGLRQFTEAQDATLKKIYKANAAVDELPLPEQVALYRYIMTKSSNAELRYGTSIDLLFRDPSTDNVRFVLPYFEKFSDETKYKFLSPLVQDAILLRPEIPEFRQFAQLPLQRAASGENVLEDLSSQAAVILSINTTEEEKTWMHQILARKPWNGGVWNTLTQLNDLTPGEVQQARDMFPLVNKNIGWRLTLAAALSPYDPTMRETVRRDVENQIKSKPDDPNDYTMYATATLQPVNYRREDYNDKKSAPALAVLRVWELEQAKPYIFQLLHLRNNELNRAAVPLMAIRTPQDVFRVAKQQNVGKKFVNLNYALVLAAQIHPELKPQAPDVLANVEGDYGFKRNDISKEDFEELKIENYNGLVQQLREGGIRNR